MQLTYNYRPDMSLSGFGNYSMLSSGKGILLQGISGGVNYAIWGGQTQTHIFTNNTVFLYSFPIRIGIYAGATLRSYDFNSLNTSARRFSLLQTVPDTGLLLGIEPGINIEGVVFGRFYYTAQTAYVLPYFISNSKQSGRIISLSAGFGASL